VQPPTPIIRHPYTSDALLSTIVRWHDVEASTVPWRTDLLGSAVLPEIEGLVKNSQLCFQAIYLMISFLLNCLSGCYEGDITYGDNERWDLAEQLGDRSKHGNPWPTKVKYKQSYSNFAFSLSSFFVFPRVLLIIKPIKTRTHKNILIRLAFF
jgi:hypothetical protein